jgi:hypothetical protein
MDIFSNANGPLNAEFVPLATTGEDKYRDTRGLFNFLTQPADIDIKGTGVA